MKCVFFDTCLNLRNSGVEGSPLHLGAVCRGAQHRGLGSMLSSSGNPSSYVARRFSAAFSWKYIFNLFQRCVLVLLTFTAASELWKLWGVLSFFSLWHSPLRYMIAVIPFPSLPSHGFLHFWSCALYFFKAASQNWWDTAGLGLLAARTARPVLVKGWENKAWLEQALCLVRGAVFWKQQGVWVWMRGQLVILQKLSEENQR